MNPIVQEAIRKRNERKAKSKAKAKRLKKIHRLPNLKKKLWSLLSPAVKAVHPKICFTCGKAGTQTGHMFPKGYAQALSAYHPGNLRPQCYHCNINLGGNGAEYSSRYMSQYGLTKFQEMNKLSRTPHKWTVEEMLYLINKNKVGLERYTEAYDELCHDAYNAYQTATFGPGTIQPASPVPTIGDQE